MAKGGGGEFSIFQSSVSTQAACSASVDGFMTSIGLSVPGAGWDGPGDGSNFLGLGSKGGRPFGGVVSPLPSSDRFASPSSLLSSSSLVYGETGLSGAPTVLKGLPRWWPSGR